MPLPHLHLFCNPVSGGMKGVVKKNARDGRLASSGDCVVCRFNFYGENDALGKEAGPMERSSPRAGERAVAAEPVGRAVVGLRDVRSTRLTVHVKSPNYEARSARLQELVDEEKFRIWRVYLAGCAHAFECDDVAVFQIVARKAGQSASGLPWSRRYIYSSH